MALIDLDEKPTSDSRWVDLDAPQKETGGFGASVKQTIGATIKGAGQAAEDFIPFVGQDNALKKYGQSVVEANPTAVHNLEDLADKPWTATKEATGNALASVLEMIGTRAAGMGITAAAPFAGPAAPVVALAGQLVAWAGPMAIAALPSYSGIRDKQILNDPEMQNDAKAKAAAALGAAAVGFIETKFGPQNWALAAMTKEGRAKMAEKLGVDAADGLLKRVAKVGAKGALIEGGEELAQNPIEQLAAFEDPTTKENLKDTLFGGVMGAIGGGVLGGGFGVVNKVDPVRKIIEAPDASSAIGAALDANTTAAPASPVDLAFDEKARQDAHQREVETALAETQRAAQVMGVPSPDFALQPHEVEELQQRVQEESGLRIAQQLTDVRAKIEAGNRGAPALALEAALVKRLEELGFNDPQGEAHAQAVRGDQGQAGEGSQARQQAVRPGAVQGSGDLQLEAPLPADVGGAPGRSTEGAGGTAGSLKVEVAEPPAQAGTGAAPAATAVSTGQPQAASPTKAPAATNAPRGAIVTQAPDSAEIVKTASSQAVYSTEKSNAQIFGKPVSDLTPAELRFASTNHRMSAHREVANAEIARRASAARQKIEAASDKTAATGKTYTPAEGVQRYNEQNKTDVDVAARSEATVQARAAAKLVEKAFGLKVVFVKSGASGKAVEGFMHASDPGTVYVGVESRRMFQSVVMHEATHALKRRSPKVYAELRKAVNAALKDEAFGDISTKYSEHADRPEIQNEELIANVLSDQSHDFRFWVEVFKHTGNVRALAKALFTGLDQLNAKLNQSTGLVKRPDTDYNTKAFIKDSNAVRSAVAKAYAGWERGGKERVAPAPQEEREEVLQSKPDRSADPFRPANAVDMKALRIPPGWTDVYVAADPKASLVAVGSDKRGRMQYLYSSAHTQAALVEKFKRLREFNKALPKMMDQIKRDAADGNEEAAVLRLMANTGFRVGADEIRGEVEAIGATTLRDEHVNVEGDTVNFDFLGKRGVQQVHSLTDPVIARDMEERAARGGKIFETSDGRVRHYLRVVSGGRFKVHDFRTWNATDAARQAMSEMDTPTNAEEYWTQRDAALEAAAEKIGDTQKVAEEVYVDKLIFEEWRREAGVAADATRPRRVRESARRADEGTRRDASPERREPAGRGRRTGEPRNQAAGESAANPIVTARQAVAHDKANPLAEDRKGRCHELTWRKVIQEDLEQVIGVVNGFPSAPQPRAPISIWHSVAYDPKTKNFWEPISDRWYSRAAMKAFGFEPVVSLDAAEAGKLALKTGKIVDQQIYSENVKLLRGAESDYLEPGDYDADQMVLQSKPEDREDALREWAKGTKVVDDDGNPSVVYHGTKATFNEFKTSKMGWESLFGQGFYFTKNPDTASSHANRRGGKYEGANVMPVYVRITKPATLEQAVRIALRVEKMTDKARKDTFRRKMEMAGYDGVLGNDLVVALRPQQIKSVFNRGTFDKSGDILQSKPEDAFDDEIRALSEQNFSPEEISRMDSHDDAWASGILTDLRNTVKNRRSNTGLPRITWATRPREGDWISESGNGRYTIEPEKGGFWAKVNGDPMRFEKTRADAIDTLNAYYDEDIISGDVENPDEKLIPTRNFKSKQLDRLVAGMKKLSEIPGIFLLPKTDKKNLGEVAKEMDKNNLVDAVSPETDSTEHVRHRISLNNGRYVWVIEDLRDKTAYTDASRLDSGSRAGSFIYPAIFTWGANNKVKIMVDPGGLSHVNTYRRTEQMLSAALRLGTTRYMSPNRGSYENINEQGLFGWNEKPKTQKEEDQNLAIMAVTSMENTLDAVPEARSYRYDFMRKQFRDGSRVIDKETMKKVLSKDPGARDVGVGPSTLARAIFMNTLIHDTRGVKQFIEGKLGASSIMQDEKAGADHPDQALVLYSKPAYINTPTADSAARKAGLYRVEKTIRERVEAMMPTFGKRMRQGLVDQFDAIKELSYRAYMMARMSKGTDGSLEAMFLYGKPFLEDGALNVNMQDGGLTKVLQKLGGEHDRFIAWIAGNRAAQLKTEGRERLFEDNEIEWLKDLNKGKMPDGKSRAALYAEVHREFNAYSKAVLDIAEQQGLIDPESRAVWEKDFYVPFYRNMDAEVSGPTVKSGLVSQAAFKRLKGGKEELNDLLANTLQNWSHLLSAAMKNKAALTTMEAAVTAGAAIEVPTEYTGKQMQIGRVLKALDSGTERYFVLEDPFLIDAISSLESFSFGPIGKLFETVKRWLTIGVTANPSFKIRNLIRDSISAIGVSELSYNPLKNISSAWADTAHSSQLRASLLASGGIIRFGTQLEGSRAEYVRDLINDGVPASQILDTKDKVVAAIKLMWDRYQEFGDRGENVNRMALYKKLRAEGKDHLEASYAARDLLDFSMQGTWRAIRFLTQTVPFFNARLQGLYKGGRAAVENPMRMGYVVGAVAFASMALMLAYKDDDDWKKREDWDRDNFWWFKIGDKAFRIPKPFEIGAIGTMAERSLEYMVSDEMTGKRFGKRMLSIIGDNLAMNPIPQIARPLIELYANKDFFRGRPIETMGMENLSPSERIGRSTSATAQLAGKAGVLSPVQIDHVIRAYFGWLGTSATTLLDYGIRPAMGIAARPASTLKDAFVVGNFVESLPTNSSRYVTDFYESSKQIEQAYADWRHAINTRQPDRAKELREEGKEKIALHGAVSATNKQLAAYNKLEKMIEADKSMTPDEKRTRLDRLDALKNQTTKRYSELVLKRGKADAAVAQ